MKPDLTSWENAEPQLTTIRKANWDSVCTTLVLCGVVMVALLVVGRLAGWW